VWFSQNARGYSALAFWTLLSTFFLLSGIRTGRRGFYIAYAATAALGAYTHLTMIFLVASHLLICTGMAVTDWRRGLGFKKWKIPLQAFFLAFKQDRMVFALFALPGLLTALGAVLARGTMYPRFYFFLIGFAVLILVRGVFVFHVGSRQTCFAAFLRPIPDLC
jgi:uncharacterized membrane protein